MKSSNESERAREKERKVREKREGGPDWWKRERMAEAPTVIRDRTEGFQV